MLCFVSYLRILYVPQFFQWAVPSFVSTVKNAVPRAVVPITQALSPPGSPKSQRKHRTRDLFHGRDGAFSPTSMDNLDIEWVNAQCQVQSRNYVSMYVFYALFSSGQS